MTKALLKDRRGKILDALRKEYPAGMTIDQISEAVKSGSKFTDYYRTTAALSKLCHDDKVDRIASGVYQYIWTPDDGEFKRPKQWRVGRIREIEEAFRQAWPDTVHIQELPRNHNAYKYDEMRRVSAACSKLSQMGTIERVSQGTYRFVRSGVSIHEKPEEPIDERDMIALPLAFSGAAAFVRDMKNLGIEVKVTVDVKVES